MSDKKFLDNINNTIDSVDAIARLAGAVAGALGIVVPMFVAVKDRADIVIERRRNLVQVPNLYGDDVLYNIDEAVETLSKCGLRSHLVEAKVQKADIKYCTCFDGEVILTIPSANKKVEPGTSVEVIYITQKVIDASKRLLAAQIRTQEQLEAEKSEKRAERSEKAKQVVSNAIETTRSGVAKIPAVFHKKNHTEDIIEELPGQMELIEQPEEQSEIEE
ncbi:MAG: PASTA domain-containing protein [Oscillospiraceae bacterium]|nr:PASTA domain-containing protein [Oscillospiraceae bacterium]